MTTPCLDPKGEVLQLLFENCRTFFSILHSVHTLTITQQRCERATNLIATPHRLPHGADTFLRLNTTVPNLFTKRSSTVPEFKVLQFFTHFFHRANINASYCSASTRGQGSNPSRASVGVVCVQVLRGGKRQMLTSN